MHRTIALLCYRDRCKFCSGWWKCSGSFQLTFTKHTSLHLSSSASASPSSHYKNPLIKMDESQQCHKDVVSSLKDVNNNNGTSFLRDVFEIIVQDVLIKGKIEETKVTYNCHFCQYVMFMDIKEKTTFEVKVTGQYLGMAPSVTAFTATDGNMRVLAGKKIQLNTVRCDFVACGIKVINFKYPEELKKQVGLDIQERSLTEEEMLSLCKFTVNNSVRSTHPLFNNQLWQGVDVVGLAGLYLAHALKTSINVGLQGWAKRCANIVITSSHVHRAGLDAVPLLQSDRTKRVAYTAPIIHISHGAVMSFKVVHIHHSLMKFIEVPADDEILEKAKILGDGILPNPFGEWGAPKGSHVFRRLRYTYEMAPLFSLVENAILEKIRRLCGFEEGDGIFCPGGSMCNMYAINLARYHMNPDVKRKGIKGHPQSVIFASDVSHYSVIKGASFMGIGCDNIFEVKSDDRGRMIPEELEVAIIASKEKGDTPLIVVATSGTTVQGAYDPLDKLADVCEKYGVWLHVDAAWGGSALLSCKHKHKMKGVERADSLAWCLHKMLGVPLQCSALVLNKKGDLLKQCHSSAATYLFQADKFYGAEYDTGDKSIQCARLPDAFKAWFMWKAKGDRLVEEEIDYKFEMARTCADAIRNREGFRLLWEPDCTNVCFWYIPPCLRHLPDGPELWEGLNKFAPLLKQEMMTSGLMMITYQPLKDKVNFWRMVFSNSEFHHQHLHKMLDDFERLAKDIEV